MARSPLFNTLDSLHPEIGHYEGVDTPVGFGNTLAEVRALQSTCGIYDFAWRARLVAVGPDRVRWLNGMVTNNIKALGHDRGCYNFLLNAQGHILGDLYIYNRGDRMGMETDQSQLAKIQTTLERFIIMDDVELKPVAGMGSIGLIGPLAVQVMAAAGINASELEYLQLKDCRAGEIDLSIVRSDDAQHPSYEIVAPIAALPDLSNLLVDAGATPVGTRALEIIRILGGRPRYGHDIRERDLPQETGQTRALDFTKGCYIGQEIVERIHSRGKLHRRFAGFLISAPVPEKSKLQVNGKDVGELTSVCSLDFLQDGEKTFALGYIRREAELPGTDIRANDAAVNLRAFPLS